MNSLKYLYVVIIMSIMINGCGGSTDKDRNELVQKHLKSIEHKDWTWYVGAEALLSENSFTFNSYYYASLPSEVKHVQIYLDTKPKKGYNGLDGYDIVGADYLIEDGKLFESLSSKWDWKYLGDVDYHIEGSGKDKKIWFKDNNNLLSNKEDIKNINAFIEVYDKDWVGRYSTVILKDTPIIEDVPMLYVPENNSSEYNITTNSILIDNKKLTEYSQECSSSTVFKNNEWRLITIPCDTQGQTVRDLFGKKMAAGIYTKDWIMYRYVPEWNKYQKVSLDDRIKAGTGYWFIQALGKNIEVTINGKEIDISKLNLKVKSTKKSKWSILGNPSSKTIKSENLKFISKKTTSGLSWGDASTKNLIKKDVWLFKNSRYIKKDMSNPNTTLDPWDGFWIKLPEYDDNQLTLSSGVKSQRNLPLIVIRVEFNDKKFQNSASVWSKNIFGNTQGELNHYFNEISYGEFKFQKAHESDGSFDGIITVKLDKNIPENSIFKFAKNIVEATKKADQFINYSSFDKDDNKVITQDELAFMFIIAGDKISSQSFCLLGEKNAYAPNLDGVNILECKSRGTYVRTSERQRKEDTSYDTPIGIMAHELGHAVFNLPDLYDVDYTSNGIGIFGLMGYGCWGKKSGSLPGTTPTHMNGFSKIQANMLQPTIIDSDKSGVKLNSTSRKDYQLYKIPTNKIGEYFLIENIFSRGYNRGYELLNKDGDKFKGGLSIFHIDENVGNFNKIDHNDFVSVFTNNSLYNTNENHKLIDIEEANNPVIDENKRTGHSNNLFFRGNSDSFTPSTLPNSNLYDGSDSGISIENISAPKDIMSADININK